MTTAIQAVTQAAGKIPGYCSTGNITRTPAQILACVKAGWQEPTTGAANLGAAAGHSAGPVVCILIAAVIALWVASRLGRSGKTATNS